MDSSTEQEIIKIKRALKCKAPCNNPSFNTITLTDIPSYADDAAAISGGLTTGNIYKTTTGGSTFLKIIP